MLLHDGPLTSQPQEAVEVDWGNPLAAGLVWAQVADNPDNVAAGNATNVMPLGSAVGGPGVGIYLPGTYNNANGGLRSPLSASDGTEGWTMMGMARTDVNNGVRCIVGVTGFSNNAIHVLDLVNARIRVESSDGSNWTSALASDSVAIGTDHLYVGRVRHNGGRDVWRNGVQVASDSPARSTTGVLSTQVGYFTGSGHGNAFVGTLYVTAVWRRVLTDDEVRAVSANPWQLFRVRQVWLPASAAPSADVAGSVALSLTATGSIAVAKPVSGSVAVALATSGSLAVAKPVAGAVGLALSATGAIAVNKPVAGSVAMGVACSGALTVPKPVAGSVAVGLTAAGSVEVAKPVAGAVAMALTTSGALTTVGMGGAVAVSVATAGSVAVDKPVSGAVLVSLTTAAALTIAKPVSGNVALSLVTSGSVQIAKPVAGAVSVALTAAGAVQVPKLLGGAVSVSLTAGGSVAVAKPVGGAVVLSLTTTGRIETATLRGLVTAVLTLRSTPTTLTLRPTDATLATRAGAAALTLRPASDAALQFQTDDPV